jgi:hypothetical protein
VVVAYHLQQRANPLWLLPTVFNTYGILWLLETIVCNNLVFLANLKSHVYFFVVILNGEYLPVAKTKFLFQRL